MPILKERNLVNQKKKKRMGNLVQTFLHNFLSYFLSNWGDWVLMGSKRKQLDPTIILSLPLPLPTNHHFHPFSLLFFTFFFSFSILSTIIQPNIFAPYKRRPHDLLDRCGIFFFPEEIYWFWFSYRLNWPMVIGLGFGWTKKEESVFFSKQNMGLDFLSPKKSNGWRGFIFCSNGIMG